MRRTLAQPRTVIPAQAADEIVLQEARVLLDDERPPRLIFEVKYRAAGKQLGEARTVEATLTAAQSDRLTTIVKGLFDTI